MSRKIYFNQFPPTTLCPFKMKNKKADFISDLQWGIRRFIIGEIGNIKKVPIHCIHCTFFEYRQISMLYVGILSLTEKLWRNY